MNRPSKTIKPSILALGYPDAMLKDPAWLALIRKHHANPAANLQPDLTVWRKHRRELAAGLIADAL